VIACPAAASRSSVSWPRTYYDDDPFDGLSTGENVGFNSATRTSARMNLRLISWQYLAWICVSQLSSAL
jgi:hypothetical protein